MQRGGIWLLVFGGGITPDWLVFGHQNLKDSGLFPESYSVDFRRISGGFPVEFRWIFGGYPPGGFVINENKHSVDILCIETIIKDQF